MPELSPLREETASAELQRRLLKSVTDNASVALFIMDERQHCIFMNPAAEQLTGFRKDDVRGRPLHDFVHHTHLDGTPYPLDECPIDRAFPEENQVHGEEVFVHRDGHFYDVEFTASPIRNAAGAPVGTIIEVQDVTERKRNERARRDAEERLRDSEQRLQMFIEHAPAGIAMFDRQMRYLTASRRWKSDYGLADPIVGRSHYDLFPDLPDRWKEVHRRALAGEILSAEEDPYPQADGSTRYLRWDVRPWLDNGGTIGGLLISAEDVTARVQAQARVRAAAEQLRLVTDSAPVFLAHWDAAARLQFINAPYAAALGHTPRQCVGGEFSALLGDTASARLRPHLEAALRGGAVEFEEFVPYPAGSRWMRGTYVPDRDAAGRVSGVVAVLQDVTSRRDAELTLRASEERFRATFDNAAVGIAHVSLDGRWLRVNDRLRDFFGYAGNELLSRTFQDITHPDDLQLDLQLMHELLAGTRTNYSLDKRYIRKDGTVVWATLTGSLVRSADGSPAYFIAVVQDISDRKEAEAALQEADRRKDEFLAILAHELRNPLAPIRTATALLGGEAGTDPMVARTREVIDRQVTHMTRLLDDLLDVSRLSSGRLELRRAPVMLREVIDAALETAQPLVEQHGQQLCVTGLDESVPINADATRLTQVFGNLLNNAASYSDPGTSIEVSAHRDNGTVSITVRDHGIGIATDMLDHVFESFRRGDDAQRRAPRGIGIGLSLAKQLVEMHDGTIVAESDGPGTGSAFTVRLPVLDQPATSKTATVVAPAQTAAATPLRVLVVDDNVDAADMMALLLQSTGEVHTTHCGESAIREAAHLRPDVILLDIGLPDVDGHEVCRRLRAEPWGKGIAIIAVTGWGQDHDRQRSAASGFDRHLVKPASPDEVLAIVRAASQGRAAVP